MKNTMRNTLLVTVAATALIAGAGLASAQGTGGEAPGAATHEPKAPGGKIDQHPSSVPPKSPAPNAHGAHEAGTDRTCARKGDSSANRTGARKGKAG